MRIRNVAGEILEEIEDTYSFEEDIWDYLESRVPAPAPDQTCEAECHVVAVEAAWATTFLYSIRDDHICYTYVCWECAEVSVGDYDPPTPEDVPTMGGGYVQEPVHCSP